MDMVLTLQLVMLAGHNAILVELLIISWISRRYSGHPAIRGSGQYLGPFALVAATLLVRLNVEMLMGPGEAERLALSHSWLALGVLQVWATVYTGGLVCRHLIRGRRFARGGAVQRTDPYE